MKEINKRDMILIGIIILIVLIVTIIIIIPKNNKDKEINQNNFTNNITNYINETNNEILFQKPDNQTITPSQINNDINELAPSDQDEEGGGIGEIINTTLQ